MKKLLVVGTIVLSLALTGCNMATRNFGGTVKIDIPKNQKLITVTWKESSLWYLTRPMNNNEIAETYTFQEDSNFGVLEGKVIFKESKEELVMKSK